MKYTSAIFIAPYKEKVKENIRLQKIEECLNLLGIKNKIVLLSDFKLSKLQKDCLLLYEFPYSGLDSYILNKQFLKQSAVSNVELFENKIKQYNKVNEYKFLLPEYKENTKIKYPFILKSPYGILGDQVHLIKNKKDYVYYSQIYPRFISQEIIYPNKDVRVLILNGKVFCSYEKISNNLIKNVAKGSTVKEIILSKEKIIKIETLAKNLSISYGGFDFLEKDNKLYFLEANLIPGWKGVYHIGKNSLAQEFVKHYFETKES